MKAKDLLVPLSAPAKWTFETKVTSIRRVTVTEQSWVKARALAAQKLHVQPDDIECVRSPLTGGAP